LLHQVAKEFGGQTAVSDADSSLTWRQVSEESESTARRLTEHGIRSGDVVCAQLPNWWETVIVALAVWRLGAVLNPVTPIYRGGELRTVFAMAQPSLVLCPGDFGDVDYEAMTRQALADAGSDAAVATIRPAPGAGGLIGNGPLAQSELPALSSLSADDVSVLMFTSGTTGRPKGVLHSDRTLLYESWSIADRFALDRPNVFMPSPLTHITGLLYGVLLPILTRGRVVLQDRWNPSAAVDLIEREGCTFCVGATPFLAGLVDEYRQRDQSSTLRSFVCGGADVPPAVIRDAQDVMATVAVRAYGLTEFPTITCGSPSDSMGLRSGDDGALTGSSQARLVDAEGGVGDLEARGPEMFLGYLDGSDNEQAFTPDGWFRTGDLAVIEGDRIRIVGRRKDIIVRGGENLSPLEVENLLRELPGVADIAVVGVADPVLGERACAMIVPNGQPPTLAEIQVFLQSRDIARQKAPEHLLLCDALPRTASGKIQKFVLRAMASERLAAGEGESR
jgi:cyclohexanecarboxylate-CoA ligase